MKEKELEKKLPKLIKIEDLDLIPEIPRKQLVEIISKFLLSVMDRSRDIIKIRNVTLVLDEGGSVIKTRNGRRCRMKTISLHVEHVEK